MYEGNANVLPSEKIGLLDTLDPASHAAGTVTTGWIAATDFAQWLVTLQIGAMVATSTLDAKLQQASDSGGTGAKDISGKAITQCLAAADGNKQVEINLKLEELDANNNFTHFRLSVTVATAASIYGAIVQGLEPRYGNSSLKNDTTVKEIIS